MLFALAVLAVTAVPLAATSYDEVAVCTVLIGVSVVV